MLAGVQSCGQKLAVSEGFLLALTNYSAQTETLSFQAVALTPESTAVRLGEVAAESCARIGQVRPVQGHFATTQLRGAEPLPNQSDAAVLGCDQKLTPPETGRGGVGPDLCQVGIQAMQGVQRKSRTSVNFCLEASF